MILKRFITRRSLHSPLTASRTEGSHLDSRSTPPGRNTRTRNERSTDRPCHDRIDNDEPRRGKGDWGVSETILTSTTIFVPQPSVLPDSLPEPESVVRPFEPVHGSTEDPEADEGQPVLLGQTRGTDVRSLYISRSQGTMPYCHHW